MRDSNGKFNIDEAREMKCLYILSFFLVIALLSPFSIAQVQRIKLMAPDASPGDNFGRAVAVDGDWVLVGSPLDDDIASQSGAVYTYRRDNGNWVFVQKVKALDAREGAQFGDAIAIDGTCAVIGAFNDSPTGIASAGSAYVFERVGEIWIQRAKLWASDASPAWNFGDAVAVSSQVIAIGCADGHGSSFFSGVAYVFEGVGTSWTEVARLIPSDTAPSSAFGSAVSVDGSRLVVGSSGADLPSGGDQGAAYVFERLSSGMWIETQKLTAPGTLNDFFGFDVDLDGDTLLIGATLANAVGTNSGAAHVFRFNGGAWLHDQVLTGSDTVAYDQFGSWLDLDNGVALMTAHLTDDYASDSGSGYVFAYDGSLWRQEVKLLPEDSYESHLAGIGCALSGRTAILGCRSDDSLCPTIPSCNSGAAYIFELPANVAQYGSCATAAPCGNVDSHGGCRNWTGHGAVLQASGNSSYPADDLVLQMRDLPPNAFHRLFMGPLAMLAPFGNGQRVVAAGGTGYFRFPIQQASALGYSSFGPGIVAHSQGFGALGQIVPGQTWRFQGWYRDIAGPCGGLFNLTNGLEVSFAP